MPENNSTKRVPCSLNLRFHDGILRIFTGYFISHLDFEALKHIYAEFSYRHYGTRLIVLNANK